MNFADALRCPRKICLISNQTSLERALSAAADKAGLSDVLLCVCYEQSALHPLKELEPRFKALRAAAPDTLIGIANVCTMVQLQGARSLWADFVMTGFTDPALIKEAARLNLPLAASVGTLSEMAAASELGADAAALTFADHLSAAQLAAMHRVFPNLPLIAVFAADLKEKADDCLKAGICCALPGNF